MKTLAYAALAAAFVAPVPSLATGGQEIVVNSAPSIDAWSSNVGKMLNRNLRSQARLPVGYAHIPAGLVAVRFKCSEDGRPMALELSQKSDSSELNAIARRTVASIQDLHPLPSGIGKDQLYEAVISVAYNQDQFDTQMNKYKLARAKLAGQPALAIMISANPGAAL